LYDSVGGNDTLTGGAGNDTIYGGPGVDIVRVHGVPSFSLDANNTFKVTVSGEGSDTLSGVEVVEQRSTDNATLLNRFVVLNAFTDPGTEAGRVDLINSKMNSGDILVNGAPKEVSLAIANAVATKGTFYAGDVWTVKASLDDLLSASKATLDNLRAHGIDNISVDATTLRNLTLAQATDLHAKIDNYVAANVSISDLSANLVLPAGDAKLAVIHDSATVVGTKGAVADSLSIEQALYLQNQKAAGEIDSLTYNISDTTDHLVTATRYVDFGAIDALRADLVAKSAAVVPLQHDMDVFNNQTAVQALVKAASDADTAVQNAKTAYDNAVLDDTAAAQSDVAVEQGRVATAQTALTNAHNAVTTSETAYKKAAADLVTAKSQLASQAHTAYQNVLADTKAVTDANNAAKTAYDDYLNAVSHKYDASANTISALNTKTAADTALATANQDTFNILLPKLGLAADASLTGGVKIGSLSDSLANRDFTYTVDGTDKSLFAVRTNTTTQVTGTATISGAKVELANAVYDAVNHQMTVEVWVNVGTDKVVSVTPEITLSGTYENVQVSMAKEVSDPANKGLTVMPSEDGVNPVIFGTMGDLNDTTLTGRIHLGNMTVSGVNLPLAVALL